MMKYIMMKCAHITTKKNAIRKILYTKIMSDEMHNRKLYQTLATMMLCLPVRMLRKPTFESTNILVVIWILCILYYLSSSIIFGSSYQII